MSEIAAITAWLQSFANGLPEANSRADAAQIYEAATLLRRQEEMIRRLRRDNIRGQAAIATVSELVAILPLKDIVQASQTGKTLVNYYRSALLDNPQPDSRSEAIGPCHCAALFDETSMYPITEAQVRRRILNGAK